MAQYQAKLRLDEAATYRIRVQGYLDKNRSDYLQGMTISNKQDANQNPVAVLYGQLLDQAGIFGVLNALYDYHLPLVAVECVSIQGNTE